MTHTCTCPGLTCFMKMTVTHILHLIIGLAGIIGQFNANFYDEEWEKETPTVKLVMHSLSGGNLWCMDH